jgi:thiol-disulfide isomerase/thioredoxin
MEKKKIWKFYKSQECSACLMMKKLLDKMESENKINNNIEIISVNLFNDPENVNFIDNMAFAKDVGIRGVPTLMNEEGDKLIGLKPEKEILLFLNGG